MAKYKKKPRKCIFCGGEFTINSSDMKQWNRRHCFSPECEKRNWLYNLIKKYKRCRVCGNILQRRVRNVWGSFNNCPNCVAVGKNAKKVREDYMEWLKSLPPHVELLIPHNPFGLQSQGLEYVKNWDLKIK